MRNIQLLFRKVGKKDEFFQFVIALYTRLLPVNWFTKGFYSHVELHFVERLECFSSANKGNFTGVRFDKTCNVIKSPSKWDCIEIELTNEAEQKLYDACKLKEGIPYDWLAIFGFAIPIGIQDKKRFYCSEVVARCLYEAGIYLVKHNIISPVRLSNLASKYFKKKITPLEKRR